MTGKEVIKMEDLSLHKILNPSNAKIFEKTSKPCHVGIHWIVLAEYSQI